MAHVFRAFQKRLGAGGEAAEESSDEDRKEAPPVRSPSRSATRKKTLSEFLGSPSRSGSGSPSAVAALAGGAKVETFARAMGRLVTRSMTRKGTHKASEEDDDLPLASSPSKVPVKSPSRGPPGRSPSQAPAPLPPPSYPTPQAPQQPTPTCPPSYANQSSSSPEERRLFDKIGGKVLKMQQEFLQRIPCPPASQEVLWFRDALVREALNALNDGSLEKAQRETQEALGRAREAARQSRDMQASYLREITALRDQIRKLPPGVNQIVDVTQCEPLKYLGDEMRQLVQACVSERMRQLLSEAEHGEGEIFFTVRGWLSKERESSNVHTKELEALNESLNVKMKELQETLSTAKMELDSAREAIVDNEMQRADWQRQLSEARSQLETQQRANEASRQEARTAQRLAQQAARQLQEVQTALQQQEKAKLELKTEQAWDELQKELSGLLADADGEVPAEAVSASSAPLPDSVALLMDRALSVQGELEGKPVLIVELLKVMEKLTERLDLDTLIASSSDSSSGQAIVAGRLRTARQETLVLYGCCMSLCATLVDALNAASAPTGSDKVKAANAVRILQEALGTERVYMSQLIQAVQKSIAAVELVGKDTGSQPSSPRASSSPQTGAQGRRPSFGTKEAGAGTSSTLTSMGTSSMGTTSSGLRRPVSVAKARGAPSTPRAAKVVHHTEELPELCPDSGRVSMVSTCATDSDGPPRSSDSLPPPPAQKPKGLFDHVFRRAETQEARSLDLSMSIVTSSHHPPASKETSRPVRSSANGSLVLPGVGPKAGFARTSAPGGGAFVIPKRNQG